MKIVYCCSNMFLQYLKVAIYSLLKNNTVETIYLFLENDKYFYKEFFEKCYGVSIKIINYKKEIDKYISKNNENRFTKYSETALVRLFIEEYLQEDKVLYLDVDTLVLKDITSLWNLDIKNYYLAASEDILIKNKLDYADTIGLPEKVFNAGVLLMNLRKLKNDRICKNALDLLEKSIYKFVDQDVLNIACSNKVLFISNEYNSSPSCGFAKEPAIWHYSTPKENWIKGHYNEDLWYKYAEKFAIVYSEEGEK